jgi:hypothetical protein
MLAALAALELAAAACPPSPAGFTLYPDHCVGGPGKSCSGELKTGTKCTSVAECAHQAAAACTGECHAFAIEVGGASCDSSGGALRWHTFRGGNASVVANAQWTAYAKPGGAAPPPPAPPSQSDQLAAEIRCGMRQLAVEATAARLGADFGPRAAELARDAVRLQECPGGTGALTLPSTTTVLHQPQPQPTPPTGAGSVTVHMSPSGSDSTGDGSPTRPFFSPSRARDAIRAARRGQAHRQPASVVLAGGVYHLGALATTQLTAEDSDTQWRAASSQQPILSGAVALAGLNWTTHNGSILVATLPPSLGVPPGGFMTLFDERTRQRLVRARHPNGDPEHVSGMCFYNGNTTLGESCAGFIKPKQTGPTKFIGKVVKRVAFNTSRGGKIPGDDVYKDYNMVWQAPPANLAAEGWPPAVCNSGEGGGDLYNRSSSVIWGTDQDTGPLAQSASWKRLSDGVVHMMHNGWGNVQYTVKSVDPARRLLSFERGGYQHGRGGAASSFFLENQLELLDSPGEWYLDNQARKLYLWPNASSVAANHSSSSSLAATVPPLSGAVLATVIALNGSKANPVTDVSFTGIGFGRTRPTYLDIHERPISGDWAIHRGGTVLVTGASNASFFHCNFSRTGGNALFFSRSVRGSTVRACEFFSTGESAVVAYGDMDYETGSALARDYPSGLVIERCLMHELGVWGKQTSAFFQGLSGNNIFRNNVAFGGPRAMVNINDGSIGLSTISGNVLFNGCRESHDHGNFNSWDRVPVQHKSQDSTGVDSWSPGTSTISGNLLMNSYGAGHGIDHDDGSMNYEDVGNVVAFSHACKGNL